MTAVIPELRRRENNLDFLRLMGALAVIVGHAFVLVGRLGDVPRVLGVPIHQMGVCVFFVISGYLITKSWVRRPHLPSYLLARGLRIFPALGVVSLGTVLVLGTVLTSLPVERYLAEPGTWRYMLNVLLRPVFRLPGVFEDLPYPGSVNGSLWTLPAEFACYLLVPLLMVLPKAARVPATVILALGVAWYALEGTAPGIFWGTSALQSATPWVFFLGGMLCALLVPRDAFRLDLAFVLLVVSLVATALVPGQWRVVLWITLPYTILSFGLTATPFLRRSSRFGDVSYGLYIFAFPVQQVVIAHLGVLPLAANVGVVTGVTLVLAFASWHLVEAPAMTLKTRVEAWNDRRASRADAETVVTV